MRTYRHIDTNMFMHELTDQYAIANRKPSHSFLTDDSNDSLPNC